MLQLSDFLYQAIVSSVVLTLYRGAQSNYSLTLSRLNKNLLEILYQASLVKIQ